MSCSLSVIRFFFLSSSSPLLFSSLSGSLCKHLDQTRGEGVSGQRRQQHSSFHSLRFLVLLLVPNLLHLLTRHPPRPQPRLPPPHKFISSFARKVFSPRFLLLMFFFLPTEATAEASVSEEPFSSSSFSPSPPPNSALFSLLFLQERDEKKCQPKLLPRVRRRRWRRRRKERG